MYGTKKKEIDEQSRFCLTLMERLNERIKKAKMEPGFGVPGHTQMQSDAIRIRRELLMLSELLDPWRGEANE